MALDGTADGFRPTWDAARTGYLAIPGLPRLSHASDVMQYAIAGQEGGFRFRVQSGDGPAHSFWQFERGGGVLSLLDGRKPWAKYTAMLCKSVGVVPAPQDVWVLMALPQGDVLSFGMARLLLWSDPHALPDPSDDDATWDYYQRNWRPGAPHRSAWMHNISEARRVLK